MDIDSIKKLRWPEDRDKARALQERLCKKISLKPLRKPPKYIAGVDAAFFDDKIVCVACLYKYPELTPVEEVHVVREVTFPYIPGMLSFREGPAIIDAIEALKIKPGVVLFDGQGIAHPKGLGIASFIGILLNIPSIGSAKSRLVGSHGEPGKKRGSRSPLEHKGRVVGAVVRTQDSTRPLYVSPGHMIDIEGAIEIVLNCALKYRLTEPVRAADILTKKLKKELLGDRGKRGKTKEE